MTEGVLQQNIEEIVREAASFMTRDFTVASKGTIANQVTSSDVAVEGFLKQQLAKLLRFLVGIEELANVGAEQMVPN